VKRLRLAVLLALVACTSPAPRTSSPAPSPSAVASPSPSPAPPVRFAVIGDWGAGTPAQRAVAERMCAVRRTHPFDVVVTAGDNFYGPDGTATRRTFDVPEACLLRARITWRATWGNHDVAGASTGTVLGAKNRWYSWRLGSVELFMLDSNQTASAAQRRWLQTALASSRAPVKIAVFHHPPYTGGFHVDNEGVKRAWVPLFRQYRVALVVSGHNHAYEHSRVDGIDYVVSGGGGAATYPCVSRPPTLLYCRSLHHFLLVEATGATVGVMAVTSDGGTLDRFEATPARSG
jgi:3',5'-cyclic AMP phosphodiesterase CpdA